MVRNWVSEGSAINLRIERNAFASRMFNMSASFTKLVSKSNMLMGSFPWNKWCFILMLSSRYEWEPGRCRWTRDLTISDLSLFVVIIFRWWVGLISEKSAFYGLANWAWPVPCVTCRSRLQMFFVSTGPHRFNVSGLSWRGILDAIETVLNILQHFPNRD